MGPPLCRQPLAPLRLQLQAKKAGGKGKEKKLARKAVSHIVS
jgi:hypothetical protein